MITIEEVKKLYLNEWILLKIEKKPKKLAKEGEDLLHSKDYLELCYKEVNCIKMCNQKFFIQVGKNNFKMDEVFNKLTK